MNDPKNANPIPANDEIASAPADEAPATEPVDPIAALEAERSDLKDKLLRSLADMENLRRRTARDVHDARAYAVTAFARDMLTVADNIDRALGSLSADAKAADASKVFIEGVELTARDLLKTLERHGVKKLEPLGQKFDPNFHQAMFEAPSEDIPAGHVVTVIQPGYAIAERVLRPALVGVSKGAARQAPEAPASNGAASG